jgi:peptide deformylase
MNGGETRIREVIRLGHPALRSVAEPVPEEWFTNGKLRSLGEDLIHTMLSERGVGLAAPQVAEPVRLFSYWVPAQGGEAEIAPTVLVNPEVKAVGDERREGWEGCLSIPDLRGLVPRHHRIKVKARSLDGRPMSITVDGFHARVIQHEYDHLDGVVFLDRMRSTASLAYEEEWEQYVLDTPDDHE